jgi:NAD(P)-dependent dehydrogenase (short-subunit alcohol dehydrogenase family)
MSFCFCNQIFANIFVVKILYGLTLCSFLAPFSFFLKPTALLSMLISLHFVILPQKLDCFYKKKLGISHSRYYFSNFAADYDIKNRIMTSEKIVLVTGANKGIGYGIAKHLGLSGWKVILGARDEQRAEKAIGQLKSAGIDVLGWVKIELKDLAGIERAANEIGERFPALNLLVNNAGIPGDMSVDSEHTELSDIRETLEVNFIGTWALTKALIPLLAKNSGRIDNVTVPSEISPYWHPLAYVASKAAQNAMMGIMAIEFQQSNTPVEIFSVHPGPTTTDLNGNMSLPGFHDIETVGEKFTELMNDGQSHQGEFIELYPIVEEN